jgi:hypothetical protein
MVEKVRTSEKSVDNNFTRQYIPEDNSEHHTRRRENLKSHTVIFNWTEFNKTTATLSAEIPFEMNNSNSENTSATLVRRKQSSQAMPVRAASSLKISEQPPFYHYTD